MVSSLANFFLLFLLPFDKTIVLPRKIRPLFPFFIPNEIFALISSRWYLEILEDLSPGALSAELSKLFSVVKVSPKPTFDFDGKY